MAEERDDAGSLRQRAAIETLAGALTDSTDGGLLFLGAGASLQRKGPTLPSGSELGKALAKKCELEWHEYVPLSTTAFYYESFFARPGLERFLREQIDKPEIAPSDAVEGIVDLAGILEERRRSVFIITTNYDQSLERAYKKRFGRDMKVIVYRGRTDPNEKDVNLHTGLDSHPDRPEHWRPTGPVTYLYKMHGCISDPSTLVITEEDYINFLSNALSSDPLKRLLHEARGQIGMRTVLFVGYSLMDWNFRVIFKATAEKNTSKDSYAVQFFQPKRKIDEERWDTTREFWSNKKVKIINSDATQFLHAVVEEIRKIKPAYALQ